MLEEKLIVHFRNKTLLHKISPFKITEVIIFLLLLQNNLIFYDTVINIYLQNI